MTTERQAAPAGATGANARLSPGSVFQPGPGVQATAAPPRPEIKRPAQPAPAREGDAANALLNLEREARRAESEAELSYLLVNASRVAVPYRQALLLLRSGPGRHRVTAVSSLSAIDRSSTFIRWVERLAAEKIAPDSLGKIVAIDADEQADEPDAQAYPFRQIVFIPLSLRDGTVFGHLMLSRERKWEERALVAAARLCETFSHAWEALSGPRRLQRRLRSRSLAVAFIATTIILAGFIPVPLTALAPAEVTPLDAELVTAPIDGAIASVAVEPNTQVSKGDLLFSYNDTELRNRVALAGQGVAVAEARYQQNLRSSFSDPSAKRELAIAQSELKLKAAEYDYASELLTLSQVRAQTAGIVVFDDKDTLTGKPVAVGERIMRIAEPSRAKVSISLPVADAIVLERGRPVSLYLDSDPLEPVAATLTSASFHASPDDAGVLAYRVQAQLSAEGAPPRIGSRGTAKLHGHKVALAYFLFRKPWATVRQWIGL